MNNIKPLNIILPLTCVLLLITANALAIDICIGWKTSYNWWMPAWNNGKIVMDENGIPVINKTFPKIDPPSTVQFGPLLNIGFPYNLRLESDFIYGMYEFSGGSITYMGPGNPSKFNLSDETKSYDVSLKLRYNIFSYISVFAGFRSHIYETILKIHMIAIPLFMGFGNYELEIFNRKYGPQIGLGFFLNLGNNFYVATDFFGIILFGSETSEFTKGVNQSGFDLPPNPADYGNYSTYGGAVSILMFYDIHAINTKIGFGIDYFILYYRQKNSEYAFHTYNHEIEQNISMHLLVAYNFSVKSRRQKEIWIPRPSLEE